MTKTVNNRIKKSNNFLTGWNDNTNLDNITITTFPNT